MKNLQILNYADSDETIQKLHIKWTH